MSDLEARVKRLEDIHEIGQLRAKYCQYLDDGRWDLLAELFTEDGRFVGLSTATGRAELRTFFANLQNGHLSAWWPHTNETVTIDGGAPRGDVAVPTVRGRRRSAHRRRSLFRFDGAPERQWLFAERKVTFFWWAPLAGDGTPAASAAPARAALDPRYTPGATDA